MYKAFTNHNFKPKINIQVREKRRALQVLFPKRYIPKNTFSSALFINSSPTIRAHRYSKIVFSKSLSPSHQWTVKSIGGFIQLLKKWNLIQQTRLEEEIPECFPNSKVKYFFWKLLCVLGCSEKCLTEGWSEKEAWSGCFKAIPMVLRKDHCMFLHIYPANDSQIWEEKLWPLFCHYG